MNIFKVLMTLLLLFSSTTAFSLSIYVTKTNDTFDGICDSDCSLREAVQLANETPGADYIYLKKGFIRTYVLDIPAPMVDGKIIDDDLNENGDLDILDNLTIEGAWNDTASFIDASNNDRAFENISGSSNLFNITILNGYSGGSGGGVENHATLTMRNSHVRNSFAKGQGGGIANYGTLTFALGVISDNTAYGFENDGRGEGGGIFNEGTLTIRDAEIRSNKVLTINGANFAGGIFNSGRADIRRSIFLKNSLIFNEFDGSTTNGTAILNVRGGTLKMVSSTITDHKSSSLNSGVGAAVANGDPSYGTAGEMSLVNVTITDNSWLGFFNMGRAYIKNSIILGNELPDVAFPNNCYNYGGILNTYGLLLGWDQIRNCPTDFPLVDHADSFTTVMKPLEPVGRPPQSKFHGPALGHPLRSGSIAIDVGGFECAAYDQIISLAPIDGNNDGITECDLGALEYRP